MVAKWNSLDESYRELRACVHRAFSRPPATCRVLVVSFFNGTRTHDSSFNPSTNGRFYPNLYRVPSLYVLFFHFSASFSVCLCNQFRIRKILFPDYQWSRNSPRNCSHFSHKRAIMQAKPACKHFIFQTVAFPFETPESDRNFWSLRSLYHRHHFLPSIKFGIIRIPANPYCRFLAAIYAVYYNRPRVTISFIRCVAPTRSYFNINNWLTCRETCSSSVKLILNFNVLYILYRKLLGKKRK